MVQWILGVDQLVRQPPGVTITDADFISANSHVAVDETSTLAGSVSIEGAPKLQASQSLMLVSGGYEAPSITITNAGVISVDPQPRQEVYLLRAAMTMRITITDAGTISAINNLLVMEPWQEAVYGQWLWQHRSHNHGRSCRRHYHRCWFHQCKQQFVCG
jgi:hypothetical protein